MTRIKARRHAADHVSLTAEREHTSEPSALRMLGCRLLALGYVAALGALLAHYPPGAIWAAIALAAYAVLLWFKPAIWLFAVPALLPVLDFSAWTGWFYVRESDLLVLVTLAVGYWKIVPHHSGHPLPPAAVALLALLACSYAISAYLGLGGFPAIDVNSFASYQSPFNSVRVLLGFVWAILLLPLLTRSLGEDAVNLQRYFFPGMVLGLGLAAAVVVWERLAFTGLMDFAGDYRVTGSFSDMHTGGAALDGYLMLTLPFVAVWALNSRKPTGIGVASVMFVLGSYTTLVTFTRSTYLAYVVVMAVVLVGFVIVSSIKRSQGKTRPIAAALVSLLFAYVLVRVFASGGYRTLAATMGMFAAAFFAGAVEFRNWPGRAIAVAAVLLCGTTIALMAWSARSIYVSYSIALLLLGAGLLVYWFDRDRKLGTAMTLTSFPLLGLGTVLIAWHWGGAAAVPDALLAVATAICLVWYNKFAARPVWSLSRENVAAAVLVALTLALTVPVTSNYYMRERFTEVNRDFATRTLHWRDGLAMIDQGWVAGAFGMGLGSFPQNYFWRNSKGEIPGVQVYRSEANNTFLRLGGPRYEIGYGEILRVFQTVELQPDRTYRLSFDLRSNANKVILRADICEKWLLYTVGCVRDPLAAGVEKGEWKRFEKTVHSGELGKTQWFGKRPVHFSIAAEKSGTVVDVDNVALLDEAGRNLIRNGDFSGGHDWWYFSSDRHHLPWHAKNMLLHVLFEQGWLGVALVFLLYLYALREFARRTLRGDLLAAAPLAALAGILVVGLFDSVLDVPRLTLLFYLLMFLALLPASRRQA